MRFLRENSKNLINFLFTRGRERERERVREQETGKRKLIVTKEAKQTPAKVKMHFLVMIDLSQKKCIENLLASSTSAAPWSHF